MYLSIVSRIFRYFLRYLANGLPCLSIEEYGRNYYIIVDNTKQSDRFLIACQHVRRIKYVTTMLEVRETETKHSQKFQRCL